MVTTTPCSLNAHLASSFPLSMHLSSTSNLYPDTGRIFCFSALHSNCSPCKHHSVYSLALTLEAACTCCAVSYEREISGAGGDSAGRVLAEDARSSRFKLYYLIKLWMVVRASDSSTREVGAGGSRPCESKARLDHMRPSESNKTPSFYRQSSP